MIVATLPGGAQYYSNDGQLFRYGDKTIYSPGFLPVDTTLSSTTLRVCMTVTTAGTTVTVTDADSGYLLRSKDGLTVPEAFELMGRAVDEYAAVVT